MSLPVRIPSQPLATLPVVTPSVVPARPARTVVPTQRTPASRSDIRASLARASQQLTGQPASPALLTVLTAHASLETGNGRGMYNYNFGGIKGTGPSGLTATAATHEVVNGQSVPTRAGFRAYTSLDEGAQDYVSLLHRRYPGAMDAASRGDIDGFSHALRQGGYYSATELSYTNDLRGLAGLPPQPGSAGTATNESLMAGTGTGANGPDGFSSSEALARVLDALSASAARIAEPTDDDAA